MATVAITGLHGEIGSLLLSQLTRLPSTVIDLFHTQPTTQPQITEHHKLDLLTLESIRPTLATVKPDVIIHLAGLAHIDRCEADREHGQTGLVWRLNVEATAEIAKYSAETGCHLIYLSTECVFDGTDHSYQETDPTHPMSWYGQTKAEAEKNILQAGGIYTIARAVVAYSPQGQKTLWQTILKNIQQAGSIRMATDHWLTPTYIPDIARAIDVIVTKRQTGIFHLTPETAVTPFEFATTLVTSLGLSEQLVVPATMAEIMGSDRARLRLKHACLNSDFTQRQLGITFRTLHEVLKKS